MKVTCKCGATTECPDEIRGQVGAIQHFTDYVALMCWDGAVKWLCPVCWLKVQKLARELVATCGSENVYLRRLIR